jgi:hypothetical protein
MPKAVLGTFIVMGAYMNKSDRSQVNNMFMHLKPLEKEQIKPQISRQK